MPRWRPGLLQGTQASGILLHRIQVNVKVKLALRLTVGQSVCLGVETCGQRFFFLKVSVFSLWGALSDERSGLSFVSFLSMEYIVVSQYLHR
jgi:hypothetical protein